jgi:hypothetical protein
MNLCLLNYLQRLKVLPAEERARIHIITNAPTCSVRRIIFVDFNPILNSQAKL